MSAEEAEAKREERRLLSRLPGENESVVSSQVETSPRPSPSRRPYFQASTGLPVPLTDFGADSSNAVCLSSGALMGELKKLLGARLRETYLL